MKLLNSSPVVCFYMDMVVLGGGWLDSGWGGAGAGVWGVQGITGRQSVA